MIRLRLGLTGRGQASREAAADLHARLEERGRPQDRQAVTDWISQSEQHAAAFRAVEETWERARDSASAPEILSLRQETMARVAVRAHRGGRSLVAAGLAACLALSVTWLALGPTATPQLSPPVNERPDIYATRVGERLTVALDDGSKVTLNTATRLRVNYTAEQRTLQLDSGEVFVRVAKDGQRPFRVHAFDHWVTAYGTAFDVRIDEAELKVGLLEGHVGVSGKGRAVRLEPNQLLVVKGGSVSVRALPDPASLTSWSDGFVVFSDESVTDAVRELNRYLASPMVVADADLGKTRISGSFRTGEAESFVEALDYYVPTRSAKDSRGRLILTKR
jgi:transmembrane sensor